LVFSPGEWKSWLVLLYESGLERRVVPLAIPLTHGENRDLESRFARGGGMMQRRDLLALGAAAMALRGGAAMAQNAAPAAGAARLIRVYSAPNGDSLLEEIEISANAGPVPVTQMTAGVYSGSGARAPDWHTAPRRQFAINMTGELEVEITNGQRRKIGAGDLVYLEDVTGMGHVTRALGPITNLFIHVADHFDVVAWARGA
jgi:hypothetical protein